MSKLQVVVGGQFGSEGKGHLTAQLGARAQHGSLVVRVGGPNAGHTVWSRGTEYKLRQLPTPVVFDDIEVALGAKSVIDPEVLRTELALFPRRRVYIDPQATILEPEHQAREAGSAGMAGIGSTRKGIGEARVSRLRREGRIARDLWGEDGTAIDPQIICRSVGNLAREAVAMRKDVIVEAAQGYGLGLHAGWYPYCTSADCTAIDALAEAQINPWELGLDPEVWMAVRPYPIRVAGTSGPLANETSWFELGLAEERTTVTNKVRRVGHWDPELVANAVRANGGGEHVRIGLLMIDQLFPALAGMDDPDQFVKEFAEHEILREFLTKVRDDSGAPVAALGTGPDTMLFSEDLGKDEL